jgi:flavin-dependent dehydrogenase
MKTQVAIVGGGPGGSTAAITLAKHGISSIIIEKDKFPRYHIGESMTGEAGGIMRQLGMEEDMRAANHPIKHGVKVYGTDAKTQWFVPVKARDERGELFDQTTWQVRRSVFDKMMLEGALKRGATLIEGQATRPILDDDGGVKGVEVNLSSGGKLEIESEVLLDCSGQSTFLANLGLTGPKYRGHYDRQIAIFSQVAGTVRDTGGSRDTAPDNTLIFYQKKYHWAWFIPLDGEVVSVGVVIPSAYFLNKKETREQFLRRELQELNPELRNRVPDTRFIEETRSIVNYSFQVRRFTGKGYICIGDAHRFIDPIFSFGLYATMKEAMFAADSIKAYLNGFGRDLPNPFARHQEMCERGLDVFEDMIDTFWEHPLAFALFLHNRYTEQIIDIFAGRVFHGEVSKALMAMRRLLNRERLDETWDEDSIPVGSRYHPERASLWENELPAGLEELLRQN